MGQSEQKINKHLYLLLDNAFDFLEVGIQNFKDNPKYSIINFAASIELFLKARLLKEHWSLIISGDEPNFQKFLQGDFTSINFKDLIPKIKAIIGENEIPNDARSCFDGLAKDRNKTMHFYHNIIADNSDNEIINLAAKQLKGWVYLEKLLIKWKNLFLIYDEYDNKVRLCDDLIKSHRDYLLIKYESIKGGINDRIKQGARYTNCDRCNFEAVKLDRKISNNIYVGKCEVCEYDYTHGLIVKCPECHEPIILSANSDENYRGLCKKCQYKLSVDDIYSLSELDTSNLFCNNCDNRLVIAQQKSSNGKFDYIYLCPSCFFVTDKTQVCDYCFQEQIGYDNLSKSYFLGCNWCEGAIQRDLITGEHGDIY